MQMPKVIVIPDEVMQQARNLASRSPRAANTGHAQEYMRVEKWGEALPFAIDEAFASATADALVRVGICFQKLAEAAVSASRFTTTDREYLDCAVQFFDCAEAAGDTSSEFYTLRGGALLLKTQVASDLTALSRAESDIRRACELDPHSGSARRNLERAKMVRARFVRKWWQIWK